MPDNNRSIGSQGLEQGGPNLGNDITREDLSIKNAGDPLTAPKPMSAENKKERDVEKDELDDEIDAEDLAEEDDEDEEDDDDETEEENRIL